MKVEVSKRELLKSLAVVSHTVGSSEASGAQAYTTHFFFEAVEEEGKEPFLRTRTANGYLTSMAPVEATLTLDKHNSFTVESKRLRAWLSAVPDNVAITFEFDGAVVSAEIPRGSQEFQSLNPDRFPIPNESGMKETGKTTAARLKRALLFAGNFVSPDTENNARWAVTEARDGLLLAGVGSRAVSTAQIQGLEKCTFRVLGKDVSSMAQFLKHGGEEDVIQIIEGPRGVVFVRPDGAFIREAKYQSAFPPLKVGKYDPPLTWIINKALLKKGVKFLVAGAPTKEDRLRFRRKRPGTKDKTLILSMKATTGREKELEIDAFDIQGELDLPADGFHLSYPYLQGVLSVWEGDNVNMGLRLVGKGGTALFQEEQSGDQFLVAMGWLK